MGKDYDRAKTRMTDLDLEGTEVDGPSSSTSGALAKFADTTGHVLAEVTPASHITDLAISAVTGVDGTGSNAASKADVDTAFAAVVAKVNSVLDALEAVKAVAAS